MGSGRLAALAIGLSLLAIGGETSAFTAPRGVKAGLELASGAPARAHRDVAWRAPPGRAHAGLAAAIAATDTLWDRDTGVPLRMWGRGVAAPGSVHDDVAAARHARDLLSKHITALAPGSSAADFELVGNNLSDGVRSVGFAQRHRGRPVIGGQLSFRFKADRLVAIGSEALPRVRVTLTDAPIDEATAKARARAWILADAAATASAGQVEGPFILPIVRAGAPVAYHEVLRVTVAAEQPIGRFAVYLDAATGAPVAREQLLHFASGALKFHVPLRGPKGNYVDLPPSVLTVFVNGVGAVTDALGAINFADGGPAAVVAGVSGAFVNVLDAGGQIAVKDLVVPPGGTAVWSDQLNEIVDAQLSTYVHVNVVKDRVRTVAPDDFTYLEQQVLATVNINDICNAFSDGDAINFFLSGAGCENTGRISDVIYHEFGHSVHVQGIIPGVGAFDGSLSEGIADYLGASITDDSGLARGFFLDTPNDPLRELDPPGSEWHWPEDLTGEVHDEGRIIGGALWDLRTLLIAKLGEQAGVLRADKLWFEAIRRAVDIPTMYPEALLADDDDGDLANGTPNECEINQAFAAHGLLGPGSLSGQVSLLPPDQFGTPVVLALANSTKACVDLEPVGADLIVRVAGAGAAVTIAMVPTAGGFTASIPPFPDATLVEYQVVVRLSDQSTTSFPQNDADPFYQIWFGPVTPLFCTGFDNQPEAEGWSLGAQWQWGPPTGQGGDPAAPFSGGAEIGLNLNGTYTPGTATSTLSPVVATQGFKTVRLQYRRWLGVEDGFFDQASILANGKAAWTNFNSQAGDLSKTQHRDLEWRFHDVDLTDFVVNDAVQLEFSLISDGGLEFAGWNLDDVCVVGLDAAQGVVCGDGLVDITEGCDNGPNNNDTLPDACRTNCQQAHCGDLVVDSVEQCDDGNLAPGDGCDATCLVETPPSTTIDPPTTSDGDDDGPGSETETEGASETETDAAEGGLDGDLVEHGCACRSDGPVDLPALGLGLLGLAGLRRRRRAGD